MKFYEFFEDLEDVLLEFTIIESTLHDIPTFTYHISGRHETEGVLKPLDKRFFWVFTGSTLHLSQSRNVVIEDVQIPS